MTRRTLGRPAARFTAGIAAAPLVVAMLLATGACAKKGEPSAVSTLPSITTGSSAEPTGPATPDPVKTTGAPPVDPALVFAADGIGPYQLGKSLAGLDASDLVTNLFNSPICPGVTIAEATGKYAGKLRLAFNTDEKLWYIDTDSTTFQTPSGGKVGMTMAKLKSIYGSKGTQIPSGGGHIGGLLVPVSGGQGIVFLQGNDGKAFSMSAGPADLVKSFAEGGEGC